MQLAYLQNVTESPYDLTVRVYSFSLERRKKEERERKNGEGAGKEFCSVGCKVVRRAGNGFKFKRLQPYDLENIT
jgi:hypothetical protein